MYWALALQPCSDDHNLLGGRCALLILIFTLFDLFGPLLSFHGILLSSDGIEY